MFKFAFITELPSTCSFLWIFLFLDIAKHVDQYHANWGVAQHECFKKHLIPSNVQSILNTVDHSEHPDSYAQPYWTGVMREYTIVPAQGWKLLFNILAILHWMISTKWNTITICCVCTSLYNLISTLKCYNGISWQIWRIYLLSYLTNITVTSK